MLLGRGFKDKASKQEEGKRGRRKKITGKYAIASQKDEAHAKECKCKCSGGGHDFNWMMEEEEEKLQFKMNEKVGIVKCRRANQLARVATWLDRARKLSAYH